MEPLSLLTKATILLAAAGLFSALLARASASVRHLVWRAAFVTLCVLPLLIAFAPSWQPPEAARQIVGAAPARFVLTVFAGADSEAHSPVNSVWTLWGAGLALLLFREVALRVRGARLLERATPMAGRPGVVLSAEVGVPAVFGTWRPVIVLPSSARTWLPDRLELVLSHERTHIARSDPFWFALARLAAFVWWPQPLVWYALSRLKREAEHACDDGVLQDGGPASSYAAHLVEIAAAPSSVPNPHPGVLAMIHKTELERRLRAVLNPSRNRRPAARGTLSTVTLLTAALLLPLASFRAPAFSEGGRIEGVVEDASGARVPKARVVVSRAVQKEKAEAAVREFAITNDAGEFSLEPLDAGTYTVEVRQPGFAALRLEGVAVSPEKPARLRLTLNIGQISERMTVQAEGPSAAPAPSPTAAPAGPPKRILVGGNVQAAKLLDKAAPRYPADCKAEGVSGTVLLRAVIGTDGSIVSLEPINKLVDERLVQASLEAVRLWRYQPTLLNGKPVEVITEVEINFTLTR